MAKHTYTAGSDGTIKLHNELIIAKHVFTIDEVYQYVRATDLWNTVTQGNAYTGTAPKWLAKGWTFDGSVPHKDSRLPVRMVYTSLGSHLFRRDFQRLQNEDWKTFTSELCRRP